MDAARSHSPATSATPDAAAPARGPAPMDLPLKLWVARLANGISPAALMQAQADWMAHLAASPAKQADLAASAWRKGADWLRYATQACTCPMPSHDCVAPQPQDKRFARPEWRHAPFNAMAQGFLLTEQWWAEATQGVRGVSRHHEDVTAFAARQWLDMWSPSNFVASNPQVLKETVSTGGMNLAEGFANWWRDAMAVAGGGKARGVEAFAPGQGVALTPGKVVMRSHLAELIQYEPATPQVDKEPVLIVPSWIMKFYILDLTPQDSLVKYLVEQGHTVFMVSWRNPGSEDAHLGLDDYLRQGVLDTIAKVRALRPRAGIHAMGYCLGGTLLAMGAALLAQQDSHPLKTISLLAAQVDFQEPGELGLFIDESQLSFLEDIMAEHGYLDGRQMAGAFQLINSKDLVWSKLVHEYLMGAHTPMTALRAWNADATRMPARMHSDYLHQLYLRNDLAEGRFRAQGKVIDIGDITTPMFVVATERDHVSPWRSVYKVLRLAHAPVSFLLTSGGHNVGIVSPPSGPAASPEASYRYGSHPAGHAPAEPEQWLQQHTVRHAGSWWPKWHQWLRAHSSKQRIAAKPVVGLKEHGHEVPAPGTYVFQE